MKIGRNIQSIAISGGMFLVFIGLSVFVLYPSIKVMMKKRAELSKKQKEVENVSKTIVRGYNQFKREFEKLEKEYMVLNRKLPKEDYFSKLLNQISEQRKNINVETTEINRKKPVYDEELSVIRVPIILSMIADYKNLGEYLKALDSIDIAVRVKQLEIVKDPKNLPPPKLRITLILETYISKED